MLTCGEEGNNFPMIEPYVTYNCHDRQNKILDKNTEILDQLLERLPSVPSTTRTTASPSNMTTTTASCVTPTMTKGM